MSDVSGVDNLSSSSNGSSSLTGIKAAVDNLNTDKQEKGSGVTGNGPTFGSSNVLGDSGVKAPTSDIVGKTDTQTLTNKTLTAPTITNPTTTGTDSGTETLQNKTIAGASNTLTVREADLSISDNTTANVSASAHGFVPKAPNSMTQFLRGDATWAIPGTAVYKNGQTTYDVSTASGSQTIAHGLGTTPKYVKISAKYVAAAGNIAFSDGTYNGTTTANTHIGNSSGTNLSNASGDTTNIIDLEMGGSGTTQKATVAVDATNITLTWTKGAGSTTGTAYLMWEAYA